MDGRGRVVKPHDKPTQTGLARRVQIRKIRGPGVYIDFESDLRGYTPSKRRMVSRFYGAGFMSEPVDKACENRMIFRSKNEGILIFSNVGGWAAVWEWL